MSGPYYDANVDSYRVVVFEGTRRKSVSSKTREEALQLKAEIERALQNTDIRVAAALDEFLVERQKRGLKERSLATLDYKLRYFLPLEQPLKAFTPEQAQDLYEAETERISRFGRVMRAQTHHSVLRMTKLFFRWAVDHKYVRENPFAKVKPIGKANSGKEQLRIDEARRLTQVLVAAAQNRACTEPASSSDATISCRLRQVSSRPGAVASAPTCAPPRSCRRCGCSCANNSMPAGRPTSSTQGYSSPTTTM